MSISVKGLIEEVKGSFEGRVAFDDDYLIKEYNHILRELSLLSPQNEESVVLVAVDKRIESPLLPKQIKRIFFGDFELLGASMALMRLLPEARLYHVGEGEILVNCDGEYRIFYTKLPDKVTVSEAENTILEDEDVILMIRAYLCRCAYLYIGDTEGANAYTAEYNSLLCDYKKKCGGM